MELIADFLISSGKEKMLHTLVVLPNKRSEVFLKRAFAKKTGNDFWLPDMLTIDELMAAFSGLIVIDPLEAYFELYRIHYETEKEKARSLDDFLSWAPLMLNDFSDIDYYLADARKLFHELSEVKVLESWNLGERPLTAMQKDYLAFFHSLFDYYERLQMRLLSNKTAYKAMAYRVSAEKVQTGDLNDVEWEKFVFVGFNALTPAELKVVDALKKSFQLEYFVDADRYYYDPVMSEGHEAGRFLRKTVQFLKLGTVQWMGDILLTRDKTVDIIAVPGKIGQVKFAGQLLYQWLVKEKTSPEKIAVVLADERLMVPLLSAVPPGNIDGQMFQYNVTMGYPLVQSPFYDLVYRWTQLLILREQDASLRISLPALEGLMQNPLIEMLTGKRFSEFFPVNRFYAGEKEIMESVPDEELKNIFRLLFAGWRGPALFIDNVKSLLNRFREIPELAEKRNRLLQFQLVLFMQVVKQMEGLFSDLEKYLDFQSIQKITLQLMGRKEVSLKGEPLTGIQVMGMLETRNLDFERVIILGANEGILPKTGFQESFIPYDLRHAFGLPLQNSKTAVSSYHFFRLLQRTEYMTLVYDSEPDVLGGGEVSRFVLQIENELARKNPGILLRKKTVNIPPEAENDRGIVIKKSPEIMQRLRILAESGISPSALNSYVRCPLQFYFRYIAEIKVPDQTGVSIQSYTFGRVVHGVLEKLYKPFLGKAINPEKLRSGMQSDLEKLLQKEFKDKYGDNDLDYGRNLLVYQVAKEYLRRFVNNEIKFLEQNPHELLGIEKGLGFMLNVNGNPVKIKGFIDRLDKDLHTGQIRIIDYKTGTINPAELKPKNMEAVITDVKFSKALQVLVYAWLYWRENKTGNELVPGIISLKKAKSTFLKVGFPGDVTFPDAMQEVETTLAELLEKIFDESRPFVQTMDTKICEYCDFALLCNRS